jgi:hypothetical protein
MHLTTSCGQRSHERTAQSKAPHKVPVNLLTAARLREDQRLMMLAELALRTARRINQAQGEGNE